MKVIPVLDIMNGVAVHAVRGERNKYHPLKGVLCASSDPVDLARTFEALGFRELYIADLDAILKEHTNLSIYRKIRAETRLELMVDAGINTLEKAERVLETGVFHVIVGTETLSSLRFIREAAKSIGKEHLIVSMDMKDGEILSRSNTVRSKNPLALAQMLETLGIGKILMLDLSRVGAEAGANVPLIRAVLDKTRVEVLAGGGIRNIEDLEELRCAGVSAALVATALHSGKLLIEELQTRGFL